MLTVGIDNYDSVGAILHGPAKASAFGPAVAEIEWQLENDSAGGSGDICGCVAGAVVNNEWGERITGGAKLNPQTTS